MRPLRTITTALLTAALLGASVVPAAASGSGNSRSESAARSAPRISSASGAPKIRAGRVLVRLKGEPTAEKLARVYESADTSAGAVRVIRGEMLSWRVPAGVTDAEFTEQLEATGEIAYAELDYTRELAEYTPPAYVAPNDPAFNDTTLRQETAGGTVHTYNMARSWWLRDINAPGMWAGAYTGPNVTGKYPLRADGNSFSVAVLDTGYWGTHPDTGNIVAGWDTFSNDGDVTPPDPASLNGGLTPTNVSYVSHGTNVAGLIAAAAGNGVGTLGSGYDTRVVVYKVAGVSAGALQIPSNAVVSAIMRAADSGCRVISMSLTGQDYSQAEQDAINYAYAKGCIVVAARGNQGGSSNPSQLLYPACLPHVVGVGAIAKSADGVGSERAPFSSTGEGLDISAPGDAIWGLTHPVYGEAGYSWWSGTSMATPITAGALALLWRAVPNLTGDEVVAAAQASAKDLYSPGWDTQVGSGELDLLAAYNRLKSAYPLMQAPAINIPASPSIRGIPITWSAVPGYNVRYNVDFDGIRVATALDATKMALPRMAAGTHSVIVTPTSPRNWADAATPASVTFSASLSYPVMLDAVYANRTLTWTSTESNDPRARYRLVLDAGAMRELSGTSLDVSTLAAGNHTAVIWVVDGDGVESAPITLGFRSWPSPTVKRIGGADRYAVNTALAYDTFTTASTVVLVAGDKWPDALSASPLAKKLGGPVLLTRRDSLPSSTRAALKRLKTKRVVIVGGTGSVSTRVTKSLRASHYSVTRIAGPDRYTTANAVAKELWRRSGSRIPDNQAMVTSGSTYQDALIASAVAARKGWPVLLTPKAAIPASTRSTLRSIGIKRTIVVGSTSAVSVAARKQLPSVTRITAPTAASTSVAVANWATRTYPTEFVGERYYVASNSSTAFADSLGIGAAAGRKGGLLLLTSKTLSPSVSAYYKANAANAVTTRIVGGTATVSNSVYYAIKALVGAP